MLLFNILVSFAYKVSKENIAVKDHVLNMLLINFFVPSPKQESEEDTKFTG